MKLAQGIENGRTDLRIGLAGFPTQGRSSAPRVAIDPLMNPVRKRLRVRDVAKCRRIASEVRDRWSALMEGMRG